MNVNREEDAESLSGHSSPPVRDSMIASALTSRGGNRWLLAVLALILLGLLATMIVGWQVRRSIRDLTRNSLRSTLASSVNSLELWLLERRSDTEQLCAHPDIRRLSLQLLEAEESTDESQSTSRQLGGAIQLNLRSGQYLGWVLFDLSGLVVASSHEEFIAETLPIPNETMRRVENGSSTVCRPVAIPAAVANEGVLACEGNPIMLAIAPVGQRVSPMGSLGLLLDPMGQFSRILSSSQGGLTDETYAFDRNAMMISRSRFDHHLRAVGLLPEDTNVGSPLHVRLLDPGIDLTRGNPLPDDWTKRPMTRMADQATRGATGEDVIGYNDYRGVPVVGAWQWLPAYDFGVATEVNVSEAYAPVRILRNSFLGLVAMIAASSASMIVLASKMVGKRKRSEQAQASRRLGKYELGQLIGRGGMSSVYRGTHQMLRRDVAIKVLEGSVATSRSLNRFEREVQLTSNLYHPNTIDIYDYGRDVDDTFYYVMEYVDGLSLKELVEQFGRQPARRVTALLIQVCQSLAEAHGNSMVHRDIKPANLLVTARAGIYDLVKVVDFGLVKRMDQESVQLTHSDVITGSPHFMSPEAIRDSSTVDARSDLYSVGAVGYYLLTGVAVFESDSAADVFARHLNDTPIRPEAVVGDSLPDDLQNVLMSCLQKDPAARPRSALELADALAQCQKTPGWNEAEQQQWWEAFFSQRRPTK